MKALAQTFRDNPLKLLYIISLVTSAIIIMIVAEVQKPFIPYAILCFSLICIVLLNFHFTAHLLISTVYVNILLIEMKVAVLFTPFLLLSFLLTQRNIKLSEFSNYLNLGIAVYLISAVPSLFFTKDLPGALYISLNFPAMLIVLYTFSIYYSDNNRAFSLINTFIALAVLNALHIIIVSGSSNLRFFGFAGIMFVDYVNLAIIALFLMIILNYKKRRFLYFLLLAPLIVSSVIMQTRNAWIAFILTMICLLMFMLTKSAKLNLKKTGLYIALFIFFAGITGGVIYLQTSASTDASRLVEFNLEDESINLDEENVEIKNSLISRLLIWDTSLNAFFTNPIFGVGFYSFPVVSQHYYTIPDFLYRGYVEHLTPHVGYLAVLTETGIIGLLGFLFLIYRTVILSFRLFRITREKDEILLGLIIQWSIVYLVFSLFMTDAWLWGSGIIVLGILLGLCIGMVKNLENKYLR